jgi:hypothetical protein
MRKVTSHLMSANAVSAEGAAHFVPDRPLQRRILARLVRRGVIVETAPDRYYIDIPAYDRWRRGLRRRVALLLGGVALAGLGATLLG